MLVYLHAAGPEKLSDVVLAEEGRCYLEATAAAESSGDVTVANDSVANDAVVIAKHLWCDLAEFKDLTGADLSLVNVNTATKEEFVHLFDFLAGAEDALVSPKVFEVVSADPLTSALVLVGQGRLEAMLFGEMRLKLALGYQGVSEKLELVLLYFEEVLKNHAALSRALSHQVEAHVVIVGACVLVSEALFLAECVDVAQCLAATRVFLSHSP